jgi:hypothetical protein
MQSDDNKALIHRPGAAISPAGGRRTNPVIARVTEDALARARSARKEIRQARFRIGEYELREPDYRQILDWAAALEKAPEWVLAQLEESRIEPEEWSIKDFEPIKWIVEDGAILSLAWSFRRLTIMPT